MSRSRIYGVNPGVSIAQIVLPTDYLYCQLTTQSECSSTTTKDHAIQFGSQVHMLPPPKKYISNCQQIPTFFCICISTIYVGSHSFTEKQFFVWSMWKTQNISHKSLIFSTFFFCLFTQPKRSIFMEGLCAHVACEDAHTNFSFGFCKISKCVKDAFQNKGSICTQEPKH
jgi:hypothetical protein